MKEQTLVEISRHFFNLSSILLALLILGMTWVGTWLLGLAAAKLAENMPRSRLLIGSLTPLLRLFIWIGALTFVIVAVFHPPLPTILAIGASAGLAIGLGAQDLMKNVIAGIVILFDRPFRIGDMVEIQDNYGEVINIGLRATSLRTFDDSTVLVPNSVVLNQIVSNSNTGALDEQVVISFRLPASVDIRQVKDLAWEAAACSPYVYLKKPIIVLVEDVFDRAFLTQFKVKAYVLDIRLERLFASDITERLKIEINARGLLPDHAIAEFTAAP